MSGASDPPSALDAYDYTLPPELIAQRPAERREDARLLRLDRASGSLLEAERDGRVAALPGLLRPGDLLVVNATRVCAARLRGRKQTGGVLEALLLEALPAIEGSARLRYRALVKTSGRLRPGLRFEFGGAGAVPPRRAELSAVGERGEVVLDFEPGPDPHELGEMPLPPYIRRVDGVANAAERSADRERYQTVYARVPGAVAAPTAGLHLSDALLTRLEDAGVGRAELVLHVGAGTFRPLRPEDLRRGTLHAENYELPQETTRAIAHTRARGGRVIAVGTTTTRVLESCARPDGTLRAGRGSTDLFVRPGHRFRAIDGLLTNFHLPRSSLLLLVAAFVGREPLFRAYRRAVALRYRFYSYGDAMLIV